jgi:hypothetical protein
MRKGAMAIFSALLFGCSTSAPHFVKLDSSGKIQLSTDTEALQRALADCKVTAEQVKADEGVLFGRGGARVALENCMRSKGYVKS